jgi:hypothetical protein
MTNQSKAEASAPQHGAHRGSKVEKKGRLSKASKVAIENKTTLTRSKSKNAKGVIVPDIVSAIRQDATNNYQMEIRSSQIAIIDTEPDFQIVGGCDPRDKREILFGQRNDNSEMSKYNDRPGSSSNNPDCMYTQNANNLHESNFDNNRIRKSSIHDRVRYRNGPSRDEYCEQSSNEYQGKLDFDSNAVLFNSQPTFAIDKSDINMIRNMPKFNGEPNENFNSWVLGVKMVIQDYGTKCTEAQKLAAVRTHIGGRAREIVYHCGAIDNVHELLLHMEKTYARDSREILADTKQHKDESVRVYATRLRTNLKLLGWGSDDSKIPSVVHLEFFMKGLLPEISNKIKDLFPESLEQATHLANAAENQSRETSDSSKKKKIEILNSLHATRSASSNSTEHSLKSLHEKLNKINSIISNKNDDSSQVSSLTSRQDSNSFNSGGHDRSRNRNNTRNNGCTSGQSNDNRYYPYTKNNNQFQSERKPFNGVCFGCNSPDHSFYECKNISNDKFKEIQRNFPDYVQKYRDQRENRLNYRGPAATSDK